MNLLGSPNSVVMGFREGIELSVWERKGMIRYIIRRLFSMIPTIFLIALIGFIIMEAPSGDYVDIYMLGQEAQGNTSVREQESELRQRFGLDQSIFVRFVSWLGDFARGDFGESFMQR